ncbi:inositol monophosphatase [Thalassobaculum sp. OXR-137]|uniref:inositol monophosphatase family protein n=1 Tax=Thalassobaculum sp. OXR-137 TaxID=3100173 RepID=UPI002AC9A7DB|nr:inositol monophosphatase [Thalassobaculum sp. OXR-137]WPZ33175.1 inositol monophosphatase [Thalassobaculum sp. OXR-137]
MTSVDLDRLAATLTEVAEAEILPRWRNLAEGDIREKTGPTDLVTVADEAAERRLVELLPDLYPGSVVIGEESVEKDRSLLGRIDGDAPVWIVDPVDGTNNFAEGKDRFCVMVALAHRGETIASAIHQPVEKRTAVAARGEGAWMLAEGTRAPLRVAAAAGIEEMEGSFNFRFFPEEVRPGIRARANEMLGDRHYRRGCAGYDYIQLATGRWHYAVYWKKMPWDHAPGLLIHAEAGGYSACVDGTPYRPGKLGGGIIAAADEAGWQALRDQVVGPVPTAL